MDTCLRGPLVFSFNLKKFIKVTISGCKMFTIQQKILYYVCISAFIRKSWDDSMLECPVLLNLDIMMQNPQQHSRSLVFA